MRYCIHCGESIPDDAQFCIICGRPQYAIQSPKPPSAWGEMKKIVSTLASFIALCMLMIVISSIVVLYLGIPEIVDVWNYPVSIFVIFNGVHELFTVDAMLVLYLFFIAGITASIALLMKRSKEYVQEIRMKPIKEHSPIYVVCTLIMASIFVSIVFQILISTAVGVDPVSPDYSDSPRWQVLFAAAEAPVYEELISRVLLIGIPLLAVDFILNKAKGVEMKPLRRYVLGGGFEFGNKELLFLMVSSIIFGYAHFGSWDVFKIIPSMFAGLAMGYLYLRYGLYASISFHAINNLIGFSNTLISNDAFSIVLGIVSLAMVVFGAAYFINYAVKSSRWLKQRYFQSQVSNETEKG